MQRVFFMLKPLGRWLAPFAALTAIFAASAAPAGDLGLPAGPVVLAVEGRIANTNTQGAAIFDEAMLEAMPRHRIETSTPWTDGRKVFEGVRLSDILDLVGIGTARALRLVALNEYENVIEVSDAATYGVLLAMRMDGKALGRRNKGPIWIVYPRDDFVELQDERRDARWVWQLSRIEVR